MTKKTTTKKTTTKKASSKTAAKKTPDKKTLAKKTPRMSASAARAEGAAKTKRARQAKAVPQDHEVPSPKEIANDANLEAYAKRKAPKQPRSKKIASERKPSGLDLAAKVLAEAGEPLAAKAIAERAIAAGWTTSGKTPHATLYAAIIREISKKGDAARFKKTDRGLFVAAEPKGGR